MLHLDRLSDLKRRGVAARLLSNPGQKVRPDVENFHDPDDDLRDRSAAMSFQLYQLVIIRKARFGYLTEDTTTRVIDNSGVIQEVRQGQNRWNRATIPALRWWMCLFLSFC